MKKVIDLTHFAQQDPELAQAIVKAAADSKEFRDIDEIGTVIEQVSPNGPEDLTIELAEGATETEFWTEILVDVLSNDDWMDRFKEHLLDW